MWTYITFHYIYYQEIARMDLDVIHEILQSTLQLSPIPQYLNFKVHLK